MKGPQKDSILLNTIAFQYQVLVLYEIRVKVLPLSEKPLHTSYKNSPFIFLWFRWEGFLTKVIRVLIIKNHWFRLIFFNHLLIIKMFFLDLWCHSFICAFKISRAPGSQADLEKREVLLFTHLAMKGKLFYWQSNGNYLHNLVEEHHWNLANLSKTV